MAEKLVQRADRRARGVQTDHVHLFGARDLKPRKYDDSGGFEGFTQIRDTVHAAVVRDPDHLDFGLQAAIDERGVVFVLGESMLAALILLRVGPRIHLERAFPEFRIVTHEIRPRIGIV
jgi:hypothetical protein